MMTLPSFLNSVWLRKCEMEGRRFARATRDVAGAQTDILHRILVANRDTAFGREHQFASSASPLSFQEHVPLANWEDYAAPIARIAAGEANVLTRETVELFEPTSGTTVGEKLIPCTDGLRHSFQRGLAAWIADLFTKRPAVARGRAYWSISPALGPERRSPGGIPIGFADDAAYLGRLEQCALRRLLAVPGEVARVADVPDSRYCTLRFLLAAADLSLISIWNPTFLTTMLAPLPQWHERLIDDIRHGTLNTPGRTTMPSSLRDHFRPEPERADCLRSIWGSSDGLPEKLRATWPMLALLSCWADAGAARLIPALAQLFPDVEIQPKGLLATEGFVTFPLIDQAGAALAIRCHFFEFEESGGAVRLAHQLERGGRYRLALTTAGGLYRYRLGDEIEVTGFLQQCPLLRFLGKWDHVSDLVGEKLAEPHVRAVLQRSVSLQACTVNFMLLVPVLGQPPSYRLYLQGAGLAPDAHILDRVREEVHTGLTENPYYRHAVATGQLGRLEVVVLDPRADPVGLAYQYRCSLGQRPGTIKPGVLERLPGWAELLDPLVVVQACVRK